MDLLTFWLKGYWTATGHWMVMLLSLQLSHQKKSNLMPILIQLRSMTVLLLSSIQTSTHILSNFHLQAHSNLMGQPIISPEIKKEVLRKIQKWNNQWELNHQIQFLKLRLIIWKCKKTKQKTVVSLPKTLYLLNCHKRKKISKKI